MATVYGVILMKARFPFLAILITAAVAATACVAEANKRPDENAIPPVQAAETQVAALKLAKAGICPRWQPRTAR